MLTAQLCRQVIMAERCHGEAAARQLEIAQVQGLERALRADSCPTLIKIRKLLAPNPSLQVERKGVRRRSLSPLLPFSFVLAASSASTEVLPVVCAQAF